MTYRKAIFHRTIPFTCFCRDDANAQRVATIYGAIFIRWA